MAQSALSTVGANFELFPGIFVKASDPSGASTSASVATTPEEATTPVPAVGGGGGGGAASSNLTVKLKGKYAYI